MCTHDKGEHFLQIIKEIREEKGNNMVEKQELIIETDEGKQKWCPACEAYLPANEEYFYKDGRSTSKLSSWCRKCQRAKQKATDLKKSQATRVEIISLDFTEYAEMYNKLAEDAKHDFRELEQHILWIINDYFNRMPA